MDRNIQFVQLLRCADSGQRREETVQWSVNISSCITCIHVFVQLLRWKVHTGGPVDGDRNTQFVQLLRCADSGQRGPEGEARPAQVPHQGNFSELQLHSIHVLKCHIKATEMQLQ